MEQVSEKVETITVDRESIRNDALRPIRQWGRNTIIWIGILLLIMGWGLFSYMYQLWYGLEATAMRDYVMWGLYIATFVFLIGLSHSGTLISGILRITNQNWRMPITRAAELMTVVTLIGGGSMVLFDLGRPDRILHVIMFGRLQSPLLWDFISITTYLVGSLLFLYLPMIPDMALCKERLKGRASRFRLWLYDKLSMGWSGTSSQYARLESSMKVMTIVIIPLAASVHTVVSYIFAMTLRPGWDSTIFGPYFVVGALYSGAATVVLAIYAFRKLYNLEKYITFKHFNLMGQILLALTLIYAYFNVNEYWIPAYHMAADKEPLLTMLFSGEYSIVFWILQFGTVVLPCVLLSFSYMRRPLAITIISIIIVAGAWIKRYIMVVPTLKNTFVPMQDNAPAEWTTYFPNWVEFSVTFGVLAGLFLIITLFAKIFPIMSIWEVEEGEEVEKAHQLAREELKMDGK